MTDLTTSVGSVSLRAAVMTASGASGHGAELAPYGRLADLGAVVVKSLSDKPWPGNPAPRLHPLRDGAAGMINSVGLQGPGTESWLEEDLPALIDAGADVVASIWGDTVDAYRRAADSLAAAPPEVVAVEVNVSCPNTEDGMRMFAHSADATAAALAAAAGCGRPRWAKLSPNTPELVAVAAAAVDGGAEAVVLTNTLAGLVIDIDKRRPALGGRRGGVSGAALHPVAGASRLRRVRSSAGGAHRRCRRGRPRHRRRRDAAGRRIGGAGGHGDLRRSPSALAGAPRTAGVVPELGSTRTGRADWSSP